MATKKSNVVALFDTFIEVLSTELEMYKTESVPMAAADKATFLALFKHCDVTPEPDSEAMSNLRGAFEGEQEVKRAARAKELTSLIPDPLRDIIQ
mgnify:CR=1 FL=1